MLRVLSLKSVTALGPRGWVRFLSQRGCTQGCPAGSLCFAAALQQSLESAPGVSFAEGDLASGTAVAVFDPAETSVETLASRLEAVDRGRAPPIRVVESALDYRD